MFSKTPFTVLSHLGHIITSNNKVKHSRRLRIPVVKVTNFNIPIDELETDQFMVSPKGELYAIYTPDTKNLIPQDLGEITYIQVNFIEMSNIKQIFSLIKSDNETFNCPISNYLRNFSYENFIKDIDNMDFFIRPVQTIDEPSLVDLIGFDNKLTVVAYGSTAFIWNTDFIDDFRKHMLASYTAYNEELLSVDELYLIPVDIADIVRFLFHYGYYSFK